MKTAFAVTGSFCNHSNTINVLYELKSKGHDIYPVFSESVAKTSTRFGSNTAFAEKVKGITEKTPICSIPDAEELVTKEKFDLLIVCPCTGNTCAKIAHGITDTAVTMAVKAQLRNGKPVLLALASNDALGANFKNIGICMEKKHIFFVPMAQDDYINKPTSLVCDFSQVASAAESAYKNLQIQPIF